ncbi:MAG TPA: PucR family transcriptional regulator ligand-binding domain-containing protein [Actinomycetota bacterium]|jgi:purine catabolism regulator
MALTVGDLLRTSALDIRPVAGRRGQSNAIRWVHVSELEDPTPWLKGGELLLTTGMGVGKTPARQRAYLDRLRKADLAGLGFGTGFSFRSVPRALVVAADQAAFPIFEVPYDVPFIAITEAVFTRLVAEQYDLLSRSLEAEHTLTRAVLDGRGIDGVVGALTTVTRGWALLVDLHGRVISAVPSGARVHAAPVWAQLQSPRAEGQHFSLAVVEGGHHIAIQPVTAQGRVEAFLAVGKKEALTQFDRIVSSHALALLALELAKARAVSDAERRLKGDLLDQILRGTLAPGEARRALERLGFDLVRPVAAAVFAGTEPPESLATACDEVLARHTRAFLASPRDDMVVAVLQPEGPGFLAPLRDAVAARSSGAVLAGGGSLVPFERLLQGLREARYALQLCRADGRLQAEFADLGTYQLLLSLQDPDALRTFADSVLAPLDEYDGVHGTELVPSLRAFLERNARWESAAKDLFVHRHTLRYRMRKVEELTGRTLSSARDRMEFFLALRARDLLSADDRGAARKGPVGR